VPIHAPPPGHNVRAIPTTSAPSHIRYTLCHEAETCLFIKEMGPLGFSVNAIDPILVFNGHDGILEVRINSEAQKWGRRWTCPIREAKWGSITADHESGGCGIPQWPRWRPKQCSRKALWPILSGRLPPSESWVLAGALL